MKKILFLVVLLQVGFCFALNFDDVYHNYLGKSAYEKGDFSAASKAFAKMTAGKKEKNGQASFNLGDSYYKDKDYDNAIARYNIALLDKDFAQKSFAYQNIGNSYFKKGEFEKAKKAFIQAIKEDPNNYQARLNLEIAQKMQQKQMSKAGQDKDKQEEQKGDKDKDKKQKQKQEQKQKKGEDKQKSEQQKEQDKQSQEQKKQKKQDKSDKKQELANKDKQDDKKKEKAQKREAIKKKMADKKIDKILNKEKMLRMKRSKQKGEVPAGGKYW